MQLKNYNKELVLKLDNFEINLIIYKVIIIKIRSRNS